MNAADGTPNEIIYIGIGCLYFGMPPDKIQGWAPEVTKMLNACPSISDIEVDGDDEAGIMIIDGSAMPINGAVSFTIEIPFDIQPEIAPDLYLDLPVDVFRVVTFYEWDGPVTFVITEPPGDLDGSSRTVILVREHLKKIFSDKSAIAAFHYLGPSPFHVDVSLAVQKQGERFRLKRTPVRGFDRFEFTAASRLYDTVDDALPDLLEELTAELSLYYRLVAEYNERMHVREEVGNLTRQLIAVYEGTGFKAWVARVLTSAAKMRRLALRAITEQYGEHAEAVRAKREIDKLYSSNTEPYFKDYLDNEISQSFSDDLSAARDIAALIDQVRGRQIETVSLFLSALVGGLAGTLVSLLIH